MARMSVHFPTMLLRFPRYHNTKLGITTDYNFATDLQIQSTFQSYGLPPYAQRSPRKVGVYKDDPSHVHAMNKDFGTGMHDEDTSQLLDSIENPVLARLFPVYPESNHTIAQFPVQINLPYGRLRKYDENPDLLASLFHMCPKVNHPSLILDRIENPVLARLFPVHHNLPDDRLRLFKSEFGNPENQVELFGSVRQFQFQDGDFDLIRK
jgi:hypothetical protein